MSTNYEIGRWINPHDFWNPDDIRNLPYVRQEFNDEVQRSSWQEQGHQPRTGALFDMRRDNQPVTTARLIEEWGKEYDHVGISYYRMDPGDNLPYHSDSYARYIEIHKLGNRKKDIWRHIVFVEDWKPGHILEIDGIPVVRWRAGDVASWQFDTPHMAANLGWLPRYTIQITGVRKRA